MKIAVLGGCNVDFITTSKHKVVEGTSNIADISIYPGGVGRNIVQNLVNMGAEVTFITSLGRDILSHYIECNLSDLKADSRIIRKDKTGIYMALINESGALNTAFCDMKCIEEITFEDIMNLEIDFKSYDGVIIDSNLNKQTINDICKFFRKINIPYALETVSNEKCIRVQDALKGSILVKPNRFEAEALTGYPCKTFEDVKKLSRILHLKGVKNVIISLGEEGFYFYNEDFEGHFEVESKEVVDVTGAGDSILSSAFLGILMGLSPNKTCTIARRCAYLTSRSKEPASSEITPNIFDLEEIL